MPNQKRLAQRLTSLQAKTQKIQGKLGQTALGTGPSAPGLTSLVDPAAGTLTGDMQPPTPDLSGQAGDMQPPVSALPTDPGVSPTPLTTQGLVGQFQEQADEANRMNELRYQQGLGIHEQIVGMFDPESTYGAGFMDQYQREKERQLATQEQGMISRGLYNTTTAVGMESDYEQRVGVPMRLQMADLMMSKQAEALSGQAGFIERREDIPPDPALMANLVTAAESRPDETGGMAAGEGGAEDVAGAASYFTGGGAAPSYAGGGISNAQYRMEAKRQRIIEQKTKQTATLDKRLRNKNKQLSKLPAGDPKREKMEDQIAQLEDKLTEAQDILDENADPIVESGIFAAEQQRKKEKIQEYNQAKKAAMTGTGSLGGRIMPSIGGGWGTSFGAFDR